MNLSIFWIGMQVRDDDRNIVTGFTANCFDGDGKSLEDRSRLDHCLAREEGRRGSWLEL